MWQESPSAAASGPSGPKLRARRHLKVAPTLWRRCYQALAVALVLTLTTLLVACGEEQETVATPTATATAAATASPQVATPQPTREPVKVTFMAGFRPQANLPFVAAYVAQEKGFFKEQGLEVDIQHSAGGGEHVQLLATGRIQFTTADAANVLQRVADPGLPLVAIALFGQKGQQAYVALADSGIETPKDWEGRTVGYKGRPAPDVGALLTAVGADRSKVKEVNVGFDPRVLTEGQVDVYPVFKSNEPYIIRSLGFEIKMWDAADYGVPTMGLTYITSRDYLEKNPDVVDRFLKATLHGLYYIQDHIEEAVDITLKYAEDREREHMKFMLEAELRDAVSPLTDEKGLGWMTEKQWQDLYQVLRQYQAIEKDVDPQTVFSTAPLERIYRNGKLIWP